MLSEAPWELLTLVAKLLTYIAFVSLSGGVFVLCLGAVLRPDRGSRPLLQIWSTEALRSLHKGLLLTALIGLLAIPLYFLLQVGLLNQNGLRGMFDPFMAGIVLQSSIAYGLGLKFLGLLLPALGLVLLWRSGRLRAPRSPWLVPMILVWIAGMLMFGLSFVVLGHVANLAPWTRSLIVLHTAAIGLWIGSFWPFYRLCQTEQAHMLLPLLRCFGVWGWGITSVLLLSGSVLLLQLLDTPWELLDSPYGLILLVKILLVLALLGLGALNKFRLVPALEQAGTRLLRRSLALEMGLAALILLLTAVLTTLVGPAQMS
jgi:putative copper resistance protein D